MIMMSMRRRMRRRRRKWYEEGSVERSAIYTWHPVVYLCLLRTTQIPGSSSMRIINEVDPAARSFSCVTINTY